MRTCLEVSGVTEHASSVMLLRHFPKSLTFPHAVCKALGGAAQHSVYCTIMTPDLVYLS